MFFFFTIPSIFFFNKNKDYKPSLWTRIIYRYEHVWLCFKNKRSLKKKQVFTSCLKTVLEFEIWYGKLCFYLCTKNFVFFLLMAQFKHCCKYFRRFDQICFPMDCPPEVSNSGQCVARNLKLMYTIQMCQHNIPAH